MGALLLCTLFLLVALALLGVELRRYSTLRTALTHHQVPVQNLPHCPPVSLIVAAHDAAHQLEQNLASWLEQDYPSFEVIVVNNGSADASEKLLKTWQERYSEKLRVLHLPEANKKKALAAGIAQAKNEFLVFTDADGQPASKYWLQAMGEKLQTCDVVLGFAPLRGTGFTGALSRWETWQTASLYFSAVFENRAYMGVGRNLAYRKSLFYKVGGFKNHEQLRSGDDDLLVQAAQKAEARIGAQITTESFVYSAASGNLKEWWRQKRRHFSTARFYNQNDRLRLGTTAALQLLFYLLFLACLFYSGTLALVVFLLRYLLHFFTARKVAAHFRSSEVLSLFPLFEFFWVVAALALQGQNALWGKPKKW